MKLPDFFGLDIGSHSIKLLQITWQGNKPVVTAINKQATPFGVIGSENEEHQKQLSQVIRDLVKSTTGLKSKKVVVSLPETSIFTQLITTPKVADDKLEQTIYWEAKKVLPIPIDEVRLDWIFIGERNIEGRAFLDLFLVAAPNILVNRYISILEGAGLEILGIETESVATTRALWGDLDGSDPMSTLVLDFGAESTDLSVVQNGILLFSQSLATGSDALTKTIASTFNLEMMQAEQYKVNYGLDESQVEGKIATALTPIMQVITVEIKKTLDFFRSRFVQSVPRKLLIIGEGAQLPGLMIYLTTALGLETAIADPFGRLGVAKGVQSDVEQVASVGYTVVTGLALKRE